MADLQRPFLSLILPGTALVLSAIVQAALGTLSSYHAIVVLNLCWLNAATTIALFLFERAFTIQQTQLFSVRDRKHRIEAGLASYIHFLVSGGFGLWLWITIDQQDTCNSRTSYVILFKLAIPVTSRGLRIASICIYAIGLQLVLQGLNQVRQGSILGNRSPRRPLISRWSHPSWLILPSVFDILDLLPLPLPLRRALSLIRSVLFDSSPPETITGVDLAVIILSTLFYQIYFISSTELMIQRNSHLLTSGEGGWTFGQTLSLTLLLVPLYDALQSIYEQAKKGFTVGHHIHHSGGDQVVPPPDVEAHQLEQGNEQAGEVSR